MAKKILVVCNYGNHSREVAEKMNGIFEARRHDIRAFHLPGGAINGEYSRKSLNSFALILTPAGNEELRHARHLRKIVTGEPSGSQKLAWTRFAELLGRRKVIPFFDTTGYTDVKPETLAETVLERIRRMPPKERRKTG
ncbi:MAG: hypothetical protein V1787_03945 [Candidatus Micrarchaeota archaeon]